jgi:hypothetical protein
MSNIPPLTSVYIFRSEHNFHSIIMFQKQAATDALDLARICVMDLELRLLEMQQDLAEAKDKDDVEKAFKVYGASRVAVTRSR